MTTTSTRSKAEPPAAAVAADAHWAAKMERLRNRQAAQITLAICDDQDIKDRYNAAKRLVQQAQEYAKQQPTDSEALTDLTKAQFVLADAKAEYDQVVIRLEFRALPRAVFKALMAAHAPSDEEEQQGAEWGESFQSALVSAASVDGMSVDEAKEFLDGWSLSESAALFNAALGIQQVVRADLGKG